jgi:hypothetical protein
VPMTVAPPQATPSAGVEIEDGVIEEARRRQRRRHMVGIALGTAAVAIGVSALLIGGSGGNSGAPGDSSLAGPLKLTLVHGRALSGGRPAPMGVTPSIQAGEVGVCVRTPSGGECGPYPSAAYPVYGAGEGYTTEEKVGPAGEIDAVFTGPGVAAVRVAHLGTFKAQSAPGLPPGAKQVLFYRPPGSRGTVLAPGLSPRLLQSGFKNVHHGPALTETLVGASGRAIPLGKPSTFSLPIGYWQGKQAPPTHGRCAMSSSLAGVRTDWGEVVTKLAADPDIAAAGWLTCQNTWFSVGGASYQAAILLNARAPGRRPAMLWNAIPLQGHPGMVEIPPVQREVHLRPLSSAQRNRILTADAKAGGRAHAEQILRASERRAIWEVFVPPTVARRVGPAWVLVRYGSSLVKRIAFLEGLRVTRLELPHG